MNKPISLVCRAVVMLVMLMILVGVAGCGGPDGSSAGMVVATSGPAATPSPTYTFDLQPYTHPSGLFSLSVPADWQVREDPLDDAVQVAFNDRRRTVGVVVHIEQAPSQLPAEEWGEPLRRYVNIRFGQVPSFESSDTVAVQADGSVALSFTIEEVDAQGEPILMEGQIFARQDGTTFTFFHTFKRPNPGMEGAEQEALLQTIWASYRVDPSAAVP